VEEERGAAPEEEVKVKVIGLSQYRVGAPVTVGNERLRITDVGADAEGEWIEVHPFGYLRKVSGPRQWMLAEFWCEPCRWRGDSLEPGAAPRGEVACGKCGEPAARVISATHSKTVWGWVQRGKPDEKPPRALDTEALADGMKVNEFREQRRKQRAEWRRQRARKMVS
jgi:hypothetical protein